MENSMDILSTNRTAWDGYVQRGRPYTVPVTAETIAAARNGQWDIYLTDKKPVPKSWLPHLTGLDVLCLASGGGQQGPVLAAVGATVTVFDNSPKQLTQDRAVAERDTLDITLIQGDMADLSVFSSHSFDLIVHPISNCYVPHIRPVWIEAFRVLRPGGILLAGFVNPVGYTFDHALEEKGIYQVKYPLPYSALTSITEEERHQFYGPEAALEFGHTLEDQLGGQFDAGFMLTGYYEDSYQDDVIGQFIPSFMATRAIKG